jgi:PAS domain S-box-containing protein
MEQTQLTHLLFDQSKDLIWIINLDFQLVYANKAYLTLMKEMTGVEKKLNESVFVEGFGEGYIEKWRAYYSKAIKEGYFEIEEHYYHPRTKEIQYSQIAFEPLRGDNNSILTIACQSRDITRIVKHRSVANQMMDASLDVFCTVDEHGNFIYVSAASTNHWGYLPEELIGNAYQDLILDEDVPKTNEIAAAILSGQEIKSFVNRYKKKDGGIAYNVWSARWDASAKLMYCVARDGKEQIEQEEKIQLSEQRFKALVQEGSDLIAIIDVEGNYRYVSPTCISILGISPEEFIGRNGIEFIHPEDAERALICLQKIATESRVIIEPIRFQNHKKEWRWMETVLTNMLDNPAVKGIVVNSKDITETINDRKKIEESELFNRTILESSPDCLKVLDIEGRIQYMNFNGLCQMEIDDFSGLKNKSWWSLWGSENEALVKTSVEKALEGETVQFTALCPTAKGTTKWWDVLVSPVGKPGQPTQMISVSRDVTEQKIKELENELLAQISINFNAHNDYITATNELCKSISKFGKFDLVEVWIANLEKSQMQLFSHFVAEPEDEKFYDLSHEIDAFKISESLVGKVWSQRIQLHWDDIENNKDFVRREAAKKIGLKTVLGIPLIFNDEAVGVLKIGIKNDLNRLKKYSQIFKRLEGFIGSELNRKKLENDLSHLFNTIPDILCLIDFEGRFLRMNTSGCLLMGFREEDILYHPFEEFVHKQDKGIFTNEVMRLNNEETTFEFENRYITNSGETIWLSWYCNATLKEGVIYATAKNITEEKKLKELNRLASSMAKIGSWEIDLINQTLFWSDEVHQLHETDPKLFIPNIEEAINFYREDFRQIVQLSIEKSIVTGEPFDFEAVLITAKKKELWVRSIGNAEFADGECKRIYGSFQNIDDRKEAEVRLQSLADNLPGVVFQYLIYPDGTDCFKYVTKGSQNIWGFSADEVLQNNQLVWDRILAGGEIEKVKKNIMDSIESKTKITTRWKYVMPNGEVKTHLGFGSPIFLTDGTILFNSVILDITQEAANEALLGQYTLELERSNEELEQFAFVASHDLQEPLRMISSFMDLLHRKYESQFDEKGLQYIHFAIDGAKRMKQIILDLLDYSRASRLTEGKEEVDMNEVFSEFIQLRRKLISEKSASIKSNNLPTLYSYKAAITQIFHCLLDNAIKYSKVGSPPIIELNAQENEKEWAFSIKDNGIGIAPQFYEKIFVMFQRLHNKDEYAGTGIGLSIAKRHVDFLGGRIWVSSISGEGSVFYFTIPKIK